MIVVCAGTYGSGSTWLFNAATETLKFHKAEHSITSLYSDEMLPALWDVDFQTEAFVIKSHAPSADFRSHIASKGFKILFSARDPRDCVASIMQRFWMPFDQSIQLVNESTDALVQLLELQSSLILRYEDGFTKGTAGIQSIAGHLVSEPRDFEEFAKEIANRLSPESVTAKINELVSEGVFDGTAPSAQFDPVTHWHPRHVGDLQVGKFLNVMSPEQAERVKHETQRYCKIFGY